MWIQEFILQFSQFCVYHRWMTNNKLSYPLINKYWKKIISRKLNLLIRQTRVYQANFQLYFLENKFNISVNTRLRETGQKKSQFRRHVHKYKCPFLRFSRNLSQEIILMYTGCKYNSSDMWNRRKGLRLIRLESYRKSY